MKNEKMDKYNELIINDENVLSSKVIQKEKMYKKKIKNRNLELTGQI